MRIADKMNYDQVARSITKNRTEMANLQNQAATQKRVTKPSDDPVAASRVLSSRIEQRGSEQYIKNLNYAKGFLDFSEQSLGELTEVIMRAKELAISQASDGGSSPQSRRIVAEEIKQLHNQAIQIANRKLGERYIFGGFKTTDTPFDAVGRYKGDIGEMKIHIDKDSFLAMNIPGATVFEGKGLSKDGFSYRSLQQPKTVEHMNKQKTEYPEQYAIGEGRNQPARVQGPEPLESKNSNGSEIGRGPASIRQTENVAPARDASNQTPPNAEVDFEDRRGENVFDALKKLEIALVTDDKTGIQESLDRLDDTHQQVVVARTSLGSRVSAIDNTLASMHTHIVDAKTAVSQLEDADAFEVISNINQTEGALQATLQTSGRLIQKSLMDFVS